MPKPNIFITYVADASAAAEFYGDLFDMKPVFETPAYIAFDLGGGISLSLWSRSGVDLASNPVRTSELCVAEPGGAGAIDALHDAWKAKGVTIVDPPRDEVFGRTFVAADPDGNLIRVAPVD
ncbi:VOC family protein [Glycomyces artemisiae]|uniref:Catechol 2,3-dioxygenase-like lactoylglutathione lyase family enzyme n=1 Tax=Glycomyces artemisiae TaxID=1076443 RepID=A0A2T0UA12_9ACTN|nr:VOC family protein [Glycomyces artemisiae]PRY54749.1 catechol 2,3-dioxygenase-like lactoylglutathione lyase family enzyme [Glycomyces artemisiae]